MHFTVAVITKDGDFDKALEPFSDWLEVEPYIAETRDDLIKQKRHDLEFAKKSKQKGWQKSLEEHYDFSSDDALIKSIIETDTDKYTTFDENGNRLSTLNPNGKWDWHSVGGRWADSLILKDGTRADHAQIKDIVFDAYKLSKTEQERLKRFWEVVVENSPLLPGESKDDFDTLFNSEYYLEEFRTVDNYIKQIGSFRTYAILLYDTWIDPEPEDSQSFEDYQKKYEEIFNNLNPEHYLTVVDCHQ